MSRLFGPMPLPKVASTICDRTGPAMPTNMTIAAIAMPSAMTSRSAFPIRGSAGSFASGERSSSVWAKRAFPRSCAGFMRQAV